MDIISTYKGLIDELEKHIAGKKETLELMFIALIANGHVLLEGVPGVAKTTMTKALAGAIEADFKRIQGTSDLATSDILGYNYIDKKDNQIKFRKGPIFTNILLVDELNRAPPRTLSGFLEALEERRINVEGLNVELMRPFITFATQNPLTIEGTSPLPKVLSDRFLVRIDVDYPSKEEEQEMLRIKEREDEPQVKKVLTTSDIISLQQQARGIELPGDVIEYITEIVSRTRKDIHVTMGASPRADVAFMRAGKARALLNGRRSVTMDDIRFLARPVLSHRIAVKSTGGIGVHGIIDGIIASF